MYIRKKGIGVKVHDSRPDLFPLFRPFSLDDESKEIDELRRTVHQKEFELLQLTRQAEIYKRTYGDLSNRVEEARIAKAVELGEVKIVSPATEPEDPIRPKKRLNVAISGVLSLMLGIFLAFFMEFWQSPKKTEKEEDGKQAS